MAQILDISGIASDLIARYAKLPVTQKIIFPIVIVLSIASIVLVARWSNNPEYVTLFSDLSSSDSAAVVEELRARKIEYEIRANGSVIAITPPDLVHELRLTLASQGIPTGGTVGFEIFDTDNLGLTGFAERIKHIRALQGELERTIESIEVVKSVRVHVTQPEKSVFNKKENQPTASVLLKLRQKSELSQQQLKGIVNLVAGSVEGLMPENVSIVNSDGKLLNLIDSNSGEDPFDVESARIEYQLSIEKNLVERIESILEPVTGIGKVIARVTADVDYSSNEREEESFDPGSRVLRSERSISEGLGGEQRGGVPGVVSNLTDDPGLLTQPDGSSLDSSRQESVKNYEVSRAIVKTSSPRGQVSRISVAVLVDGNYADLEDQDGTVTKEYKPLNDEKLSQIKSLVQGAVGYDSLRGDSITVQNIQFQESISEIPEEETMDIWMIADKAAPVVFFLMFFLMFIKPLVKFITTPAASEVNLERLLPSGIDDLEKEVEIERSRAKIPEVEPTVDLTQLEEIISDNSSAVKDDPRHAALLIRYWLNEGRL